MYANEIRFYRDVAPDLPIHVPRCFLAGSDPASHQSIVIMEDLAARAVRFLRPQEPSSYALLAAFLDAIARYHARWWNSPALNDDGALGWVRAPFGHWSRVYQQRYLQMEVWTHYMAQPRAAAVSVTLHDRDRMAAALDALAQVHTGAAQVLAHDVADRRHWEQGLLSYYLQRLAHYGVPDAPSFDVAWDAYRAEVAYGLFIFLINETHFQTEAANTAYAAHFGAAAVDHGTFSLLLG